MISWLKKIGDYFSLPPVRDFSYRKIIPEKRKALNERLLDYKVSIPESFKSDDRSKVEGLLDANIALRTDVLKHLRDVNAFILGSDVITRGCAMFIDEENKFVEQSCKELDEIFNTLRNAVIS